MVFVLVFIQYIMSTFQQMGIPDHKVRLVKAMVLPAVMYECESWTVKKAER